MNLCSFLVFGFWIGSRDSQNACVITSTRKPCVTQTPHCCKAPAPKSDSAQSCKLQRRPQAHCTPCTNFQAQNANPTEKSGIAYSSSGSEMLLSSSGEVLAAHFGAGSTCRFLAFCCSKVTFLFFSGFGVVFLAFVGLKVSRKVSANAFTSPSANSPHETDFAVATAQDLISDPLSGSCTINCASCLRSSIIWLMIAI